MSSLYGSGPGRNRRTRPLSRTIVRWAFGVAGLVLVLSIVWVGARALLAKNELQTAVPLAATIQKQVVAGDSGAAALTAEDLKQRAKTAADLTSDPIWRAYELVPLVGPNLTAVRQLAAVVDDISQRAVTPLTRVAGTVQLDDFKPVGGAIDVAPIVGVQPQIAAASAALTRAATDARAIDTDGTIDAVQVAADTLRSAVDEAAMSAGILDRAARLMPSMLGATTGPRNYVLLFQNPAELRSTGGIPGALGLVHTENGRISLTQQVSSQDFDKASQPVLPLPADTTNLYGDLTGRYIQDINLTPDFTLTGQLAQEMWRRNFGVATDGVVSIDPVGLSYLLTATGPITLESGDVITADNVVKLLLTDVYTRFPDPADQDDFFATTAASVFEAVARGAFEPKALLEGLAKAGAEHRVMVWSSHAEDQAILADTTLTGSLPISDDRATRFGVYLNDATGGKMGTYLRAQIGVGQATCPQKPGSTYGVTVRLTNTAPGDAATSLPRYVTAGGNFGVTPGNIKTVVSVYGAPGMTQAGATRDGVDTPYQPTSDSGYPVSVVPIELAPGQSTELYFTWAAPKRSTGELVAHITPVINVEETAKIRVRCD